MSIPDDLDVSRPTVADVEAARGLSRGLDQLARAVESTAGRFSADAGAVVEGAREDFASARTAFDRAAMDMARVAATLADLRSGGDAWLRDAPKRVDFEAAEAEDAAARADLRRLALADLPTGAAAARVRRAEAALRDLYDRREQADADYEAACRRARSKLPSGGKCKPGDRSSDPRILDSGSADVPTPPRTAPSPMPGPPSPPATRVAAAPTPPPLTATLPAMPTVPANLTPPAPVAPTPLSAAMPAMPTVAPSGPAQAPRRDERDRPAPAFDTPDLAGLLAAGEAPAAAAPRPAASVAAPVAATAPAPVATNPGYSANSLSTDAPVNGRHGWPAASAYSAPPTPTGLSASHAVQAMHGQPGTGAGAGTGTAGAPMGQPVMPGMGGMPAGGGGGAARDREPVVRHSSLGMESVLESVNGGTICQRRDEKKAS